MQQAVYDAQRAAGLPASDAALQILMHGEGLIAYQRCADYIGTVQQTSWFVAAFPAHAAPVTVVGGRGVSRADAALRLIKIGADDRRSVLACEQACLHELAHIVTSDYGSGAALREPAKGRYSSKGHHHAWRVNFVLIVRKTLGRQAATRLRHEFSKWGLATRL